MKLTHLNRKPGKLGWRVLAAFFQLQPDRPPDWKWLLAGERRFGKYRGVADKIDPGLGRAMRLRRQLAKQQRITDHALYDALQIYLDNSPLRWELEARILAGEDDVTIANKLAEREEVVTAYASVFFDVRERLRARDYISQVVIRPQQGFVPTDVRKIWLFFAYHGGPMVVDFMVADFHAAGKADYSHILDPLCNPPNRTSTGKSFDRVLLLHFTDFTKLDLPSICRLWTAQYTAGRQVLETSAAADDLNVFEQLRDDMLERALSGTDAAVPDEYQTAGETPQQRPEFDSLKAAPNTKAAS